MSYYFIANLTELNPTEEIFIHEDLVLKSIPKELLPTLKFLIKTYHPHDLNQYFNIKSNDFYNSFHEYKKTADLPDGGISIKLRDSDDFRYFVLQENKANKFNIHYARAFALCDKDYFIPFSFARNQNIIISNSFTELCTYTYYNDINAKVFTNKNTKFKKKNPNTFTESDKIQVIEYINMLTEFEKAKNNYPYINKALTDFFLIYEISNNSPFKIVTYIACLELLLVDNSSDRLKTITGQLQAKLNLLNNQFEFPIIITTYFKGPDTLTLGKVIETIYNYRSSIAHGDFIDFSKKLQIFESVATEDLLSLIRTVLKKVLIFSIKNPDLVRDLKKC